MAVPNLKSTLCVFALAGGAQASTFDIAFTYSETPTATQIAALAQAETFWEGIVTGYQPGIEIEALAIDVAVVDLDGPDGTLAVGYPVEGIEASGLLLPTLSFVDFDLSDFDPTTVSQPLFETLLHEIAHAMGFGSLWAANGLTADGSGAYVGPQGLMAYLDEFGLPDADFVPLTLGVGPGSDELHWDEDWAGGTSELMTPFTSDTAYLSATTIASFRDLGYTTIDATASVALPVFIAPVPLPAGAWLLVVALGALGAFRRRAPSS